MILQLQTSQHTQFLDITQQVQQAITELKLTQGAVLLFVRHTTAALTINENADPDVLQDLETIFQRLVPWQNNYHHNEGNSAAHMKSSLLGASEIIPVKNGALALGTWQGIYLCEFDGPRTRQVLVQPLSATS
ncbi:MAG: YjbQ family protein [Desulfuromonadaceae bacterium]|nr:YjbQ family protein [Desulfuromonadaceae bacterium]